MPWSHLFWRSTSGFCLIATNRSKTWQKVCAPKDNTWCWGKNRCANTSAKKLGIFFNSFLDFFCWSFWGWFSSACQCCFDWSHSDSISVRMLSSLLKAPQPEWDRNVVLPTPGLGGWRGAIRVGGETGESGCWWWWCAKWESKRGCGCLTAHDPCDPPAPPPQESSTAKQKEPRIETHV